MRKQVNFILNVFCAAILVMGFLCYLHFNWVFLPTESSPNELILVRHAAPDVERVTLRQSVDDMHTSDYVLDLTSNKYALRHQQPQTYKLPLLSEGALDVVVDVKSTQAEYSGSIVMHYDTAQKLYEDGLLIYATWDSESGIYTDSGYYYDEYLYFISGEEKLAYIRKVDSPDWTLMSDPPQLPKVERIDQGMGYTPNYKPWKENKWIVVPGSEEPIGDVHFVP